MNGDIRIPEVIVALDFEDAGKALGMIDALGKTIKYYKVGSRLFTAEGPGVVREIKERGKAVFLDLKFHDIPATVAGAVRAAAGIGIDMLTLHAAGGMEMMREAAGAARDAADCFCKPRPKLVGITVLTSLSQEDTAMVAPAGGSLADHALRLAQRAEEAGLDGIVASVHEAGLIRRQIGQEFIIVTPGIRPAGAAVDDQKRVATPRRAMEAGADYLVVGRPITAADSPEDAAAAIIGELEGGERGCGGR